jgi:parvulin-like peptidyl-prolyl isomerase
MEEKDQALIEKHIGHDAELQKHVLEHRQFEQQLEELAAKHFLTTDEELKQKTLKKLKLAGRDRIESLLRKYREAD